MSVIHSNEAMKAYEKISKKEAKSTWIAVDMLWLVSFVHCTEAKTHCTVSDHDLIQDTMTGHNP